MSDSATMASAAPERWLPVVGFEGLYEVSDLGRVRSLPRKGGNNRSYGGRVLRPALTGEYLCVNLHRGNKGTTGRVHQLVTEAFIGPRPAGQEVRHGPGGALDNRLANLCYGTSQDNSDDMVRAGRSRQGEKHPLSRLTNEQVAEIRARRRNGELMKTLAQAFGVDRRHIGDIVNGRRRNAA